MNDDKEKTKSDVKLEELENRLEILETWSKTFISIPSVGGQNNG